MEIKNLLDSNQDNSVLNDKKTAADFLANALNLRVNANDKEYWSEFLRITSKPEFLKKLPDYDSRLKWSDFTLDIIRKINFNLLDLFNQRVNEHPKKVLFKQIISDRHYDWTYEKISAYTKEIAAAILKINSNPIVAIYAENSVQSASVDLACLFYDIPDTPLNINFAENELSDIFKRLSVNIVFTDTKDRYDFLCELRKESNIDFTIVLTKNDYLHNTDDKFLGSYLRTLSEDEIKNLINGRKRLKLNEVATVMFTSGSTGKPKGISFSIYNLISKRFCRGAALPNVGEDEVMVAYLPLYHTFGRYLEMIASIYWRGTYVFVGNNSPETLLKLFREIQPSVFISVPVRWMQLEAAAMAEMNEVIDENEKKKIFRKIVGKNLKWGLSAAGYLDPKTFRFFQLNGVELCSGFGMTEATGGITMTPPGDYTDESVGKPLPGVYLKLAEHNELQISGHYVARYFDKKKLGDIIEYPEDSDYWLPTGDVFKKFDNGHYQIIDRLKDIYKNNKGQTIAPRNVENKFTGVPGIKRTFLIGDGKPYNVLLISPDTEENVIFNEPEDTINDYYKQIVRAANKELPSYERVINYSVLERDFDIDRGELTPKGSFNRKNITQNFEKIISELYKSNYTEINFEDFSVKIPRWFFRDLGILENDIIIKDNEIYNTETKQSLLIYKVQSVDEEYNAYQIGDFVYRIKGNSIDLGRLSRQPLLWIGNLSLIKFVPYKFGWDTRFGKFFKHTFISDATIKYNESNLFELKKVKDDQINLINSLTVKILFFDYDESIASLENLGKLLSLSDEKKSNLIRSRIEMLANHDNEKIRASAYRILLLDEPDPDYSHSFPAFLESGKRFLNQESMHQIATGKLERRRLEALRKRLYSYRKQLIWPTDDKRRKIFSDIFELLLEFIKIHPEYYVSVRYELTNWMMLKKDPELSKTASEYFQKLYSFYEYRLDSQVYNLDNSVWENKIVFDEILTYKEIESIKKVLIGTAFLKQTILLTFDERDFEITDVENGGIWVSRLDSASTCRHYRVSVNTGNTNHYEFQIFINYALDSDKALEGIFWHIKISGYPFGPRVVPKLGAVRPELNARSIEYVNEITLWDKIRQYASERIAGEDFSKSDALRRLFTESFTAFFRAWFYSEKSIIPGYISPNNVFVPEIDYREGATINALTGWKNYQSPMDMIEPMVRNFYEKTTHHYSWIYDQIDLRWIFDAVIEAIGFEEANYFFNELEIELRNKEYKYKEKLMHSLKMHKENLNQGFYMPLSLIKAVKRYISWENENPDASENAMEETLIAISGLYRLNRYPEIVRYLYYRDTYFRNSSEEIKNSLDDLINKMAELKTVPATNLIELSRLQNKLKKQEDMHVFSRMVYPKMQTDKDIDVLTTGDNKNKNVILQSHFKDKFGIIYNLRDPKNPSEIGQLYRLFFKEKYPKSISDLDEYFVVTDSIDRVLGGICYRFINEEEILIDGSVVLNSMKGRGIGRAMISDFMGRMANDGIKLIKTNFFLKKFYTKLGFTSDKTKGALVKYLTPEASENIKGEYCSIY